MTGRGEAGFTLIEVILAGLLSLVVLSATLGIFDHLFTDAAQSDAQNDTDQAVRLTADTLTRQLRNLASPTGTATIAAAGPYDFTFQTADPTRTWVRYCLLTSGAASPSNGRVYESTTTASTPGSTTSCPGTGWSQTRVVTANVTNTRNGQDRPMFSYVCGSGTSACTSSASTLTQITRVDLSLWVDTNLDRYPPSTNVATGVYLRNQNQAPTAVASVRPVAGQARAYLLNGSGSTDPEGRTLSYYWFDSTPPLSCGAPTQATGYLGTGITLTAALPVGAQSLYLLVCDPGDQYGVSDPTTVTVQ